MDRVVFYVIMGADGAHCRHYASLFLIEAHAETAVEWSDKCCGDKQHRPHRMATMVEAE